jgi:hypothetical protein
MRRDSADAQQLTRLQRRAVNLLRMNLTLGVLILAMTAIARAS